MTPDNALDARTVLMRWIEAFASRDPGRVAALYHPDAVNWQVADQPAIGQPKIREVFTQFFASFPDSYTRVENIIAQGDWAAWEWVGGGTFLGDLGRVKATGRSYEIRGCGFFRVVGGKITLQRGYWDKASWYAQIGIATE
jgi:steroid delta-isomerase-like uncharacterized protein